MQEDEHMVRIDQSQLDMLRAGNEIKKPGKNKYNAKKIIIDGIVFDSIKEGNRYLDLRLQQHTGFIKNLACHPKYILLEGFKHKQGYCYPITFKPDFRYEKDNEIWVEDVKGGDSTKTDGYIIRKKLLLNRYPEINFIEN